MTLEVHKVRSGLNMALAGSQCTHDAEDDDGVWIDIDGTVWFDGRTAQDVVAFIDKHGDR